MDSDRNLSLIVEYRRPTHRVTFISDKNGIKNISVKAKVRFLDFPEKELKKLEINLKRFSLSEELYHSFYAYNDIYTISFCRYSSSAVALLHRYWYPNLIIEQIPNSDMTRLTFLLLALQKKPDTKHVLRLPADILQYELWPILTEPKSQ